MSVSLALFDLLCEAANAIDSLRQECSPGSDAWCALTQLVQWVDGTIDQLVESVGIDEEDEP